VPFWLAVPDPPADTRLTPGKVEETLFSFPASLAHLRVRLLYRRFWPEVARQKHWPDNTLVVLEQEFTPSRDLLP
jgi:hypothetical protein